MYEEYKSHLRRYAESVEELRKAVHGITAEKRLFPVMNDTKWLELQNAVDELPFPPPYRLKCVTEDDEP
ncbi:MAG: hypothetical protein LBO21_01610 [Synergistaceae bacterium]|jgi:hypothetical protein|nr:hypothetical protein [Synergistaceae bacterium]